MTHTLLLAMAVLMQFAAGPFGTHRWSRSEQQEPEMRTLEFSGGSGAKTLEVDAIHGSINVSGYDGRSVEMIAKKTIRADSEDRIRAAKSEVKLEVTEQSGVVSIFVDDPARDSVRSSQRRTSWIDPGYEVDVDFELRVPRQTAVRLKTIDGDIVVKDVQGDFTVEGLNSAVEMRDIAGAGRVYSLAGPVNVVFSRSPNAPSYFGSLSGNIDVTFPRDLSADIRFKSFTGGVYTDFSITPMPTPAVSEVRNGRTVFKKEFSSARIGAGGPILEFDGFSGDVQIRQAK